LPFFFAIDPFPVHGRLSPMRLGRASAMPQPFRMSHIQRNALVPFSAQQMFYRVNDVESYPRRFEWCEAAQVRDRGPGWLVAALDLRLGGLRATFATRNHLVEPERIEMSLIEGPFRALTGGWSFRPLGDLGCKVGLTLDFEMAGRWIGSALALGFQGLADRMVDDFVREARLAHG
jgi:ribosome-associated toxin RatA of RatAB toxin-antitoxin module